MNEPILTIKDLKVNYGGIEAVKGISFDVTEGQGRPISGKALELNYGMQMYRVLPASLGGYVISR